MMRYDTNDVLVEAVAASGHRYPPTQPRPEMACHAARAVRRNKSVISVMIELLIIAAGC